MHATQAPEYQGGGSVLVTVLKSAVKINGVDVPVISLNKTGSPTLVIEESGNGRLIRPRKGRSSYSATMTYASPKAFSIDKPFDQPMSALLALYEQALATVA
jgi:hypothetical protein